MCIQHVLETLPFTKDYLWVEPSAGNGSFLHNIPFERIGLDIEPRATDIHTQNYLEWTPPADKNIVVIGNPPFGRQSSMAKSFISKSCGFARVIAFILPRSFTKPSMFNAFDMKFHLVRSVELEGNSFVINDSEHNVPCVFQIWEKKDTDRPSEEKVTPVGFRYVTSSDAYHIAFRRVGVFAGKCHKNDGTAYSPQSHHFLVFDDTSRIENIIEKINNHVFPTNTLGPRSLSKSEINTVINHIVSSCADEAET